MKDLAPIKKALAAADRSGELIDCILSLEGRVRRLECGPILCEMHNQGQLSLVSGRNLTAIAQLEHNSFWMVVHTLDQSISGLKCSYREILEFVHTLVKKGGSDGAAGMPNQSLVEWSSANPEKAKQIISGAMSLDQLCLAHCVFAIQGLGDPTIAFELLDHSDKAVVAVGLRSLGRLNLKDLADKKRLMDECFKALSEESDQDVRSSAIETAFKTWEEMGQSEPYLQADIISAVVNTNEETELALLAAMLFCHPKGLVSNSIILILDAVKSEAAPAAAVLNHLDHALHAKDERWPLEKVVDVFAKQVPRLPKSTEASEYYHFCRWIWEDQSNASKLFSSWLNDGQFALCSFISNMVGAGGKKGKPIELMKADLPGDAGDQIFMARKCVGFFWLHEVTAASILLSIIKHGKQAARTEIEELLFDPLLLCYGGELRDFLINQKRSTSKRIAQCAQRLLDKHDTYIKGLEQTDGLVELLPSNVQRRAAAAKDHERNRDIQKQAHKRSIFADIVSHSTLLYGKKSFTMIYGADDKKTPSITPLSEFSYSAELPRLSVVDPVGFHETLTVFRLEKRISR
ncbi:hypothetical protein [Sulfitobacter sp. 1A12056]|uniref:hypothetical protein n=1 Tax=Sulfitobacter sp. 1A12056 TaxID=3368592 RepID=UPI003745912F